MDKYLSRAIKENKENGYLLYHAPRYEKLLALLHHYHTGNGTILDVGRSPFSEIAYHSLDIQIDTLDFEDDKETVTGFNYQFDLNDAQHPEKWRDDMPQYNIIIFSEVIEHLYTSPVFVLKFLKSILKKQGRIILQTPNAVVLHKRLKMLVGINPYDLISKDKTNPAHYREYTATELSGYCRQAGFDIEKKTIENYFDYRYRNHRYGSSSKTNVYGLLNILYSILPSSLCPGLCFVIQSDYTDCNT